ncbi:AAA family ATPase [Pseudarcicella hirudinis]|nr:AAA family ATPase [Pseudarcicella hirudinis]
MELLYIWIENYKGISQIGVNLSNKYRFNYKKDTNTLTFKETPNYTADFFADNISNLTGLIGKNGTGKTTILRYIIDYLSDGTAEEDLNKDSFFIYSKESIIYYYKYGGNLEIEGKIERIDSQIDLRSYKTSYYLIFISNHFDPTPLYSIDPTKNEYGYSKNLSTNYLLTNDVKTLSNDDKKEYTYNEHVYSFAATELFRIVKLFNWARNDSNETGEFIMDKVPQFMNIRLNMGSSNYTHYEHLNKVLKFYFNKTDLKKKTHIGFLINILCVGLLHIDFHKFLNFIPITNVIDKIYDFIGTYKNQRNPIESLFEQFKIIYNNFTTALEQLEILKDFLIFFDKSLDNDVIIKYVDQALSIKLVDAVHIELFPMLQKYFDLKKIGDYLQLYFSHEYFGESTISSGEYTLLSFFGRLQELKWDEDKKPILILIDEAELALHPQWQKQFIYYLTKFIQIKFKHRKVQIILTSHSPFIISDLPPHCLIFLDKTSENKTVIEDSLINHKETFGANIHELFTESFFLNDGLMGTFAKKKINELISDIENVHNIISEKTYNEKYRKRINIIGERFLRKKIDELIAPKLENNAIDELIEDRKKDIELLERLRKENDKN